MCYMFPRSEMIFVHLDPCRAEPVGDSAVFQWTPGLRLAARASFSIYPLFWCALHRVTWWWMEKLRGGCDLILHTFGFCSLELTLLKKNSTGWWCEFHVFALISRDSLVGSCVSSVHCHWHVAFLEPSPTMHLLSSPMNFHPLSCGFYGL